MSQSGVRVQNWAARAVGFDDGPPPRLSEEPGVDAHRVYSERGGDYPCPLCWAVERWPWEPARSCPVGVNPDDSLCASHQGLVQVMPAHTPYNATYDPVANAQASLAYVTLTTYPSDRQPPTTLRCCARPAPRFRQHFDSICLTHFVCAYCEADRYISDESLSRLEPDGAATSDYLGEYRRNVRPHW